MRRNEREISDPSAIEAIISNARVCRLGLFNGDKPYIVPLCFGYRDDVLYFHSALKGLKIDLIQQNPNVCFELDQITEIVAADSACDWGLKYQSVIGVGRATLIEDFDQKRSALAIIMAQYSDREYRFGENKLKATAVIKVEIESMTGKQC